MAGAESNPETSSYGGARATLRDNVKWLVAAFAAIAAVIVAGSPLAGAGDLDYTNAFAWVAVVAAVLAFLCVADGLRITLMILRPDGIYASDLRDDRSTSKDPGLKAVRDDIKLRHADLLPYGFRSADQLLDERNSTMQQMDLVQQRVFATPGEQSQAEADFEELSQHLGDIERKLNQLSDFALYRLVYWRLTKAQPRLFGLGIGTLTLLTISVSFASAAKAEAAPHPTVLVLEALPRGPAPRPSTSASALPARESDAVLDPVTFAPGSDRVTDAGLAAIKQARTVLQQKERPILLLAAHTDKTTTDAANVGLARRRAERVRALLLNAGGVEADRVFVSELPESALPVITNDEIREGKNRSVVFLIARAANAHEEVVVGAELGDAGSGSDY